MCLPHSQTLFGAWPSRSIMPIAEGLEMKRVARGPFYGERRRLVPFADETQFAAISVVLPLYVLFTQV